MAEDKNSIANQNKLYIRQVAKLKQDRIVALCSKEVGWVGTVKNHSGILVIEDIFVPEQEVSSTSVDVKPEDFGIAGLMEEYPDQVEFMRYFGHSHVNMSAYWSGTDTGQIEDWEKYGLDWCINHVQNKKGESQTRFDMFQPFHFAVHIPSVIQLIPTELEKWVEGQLDTKVKEKKFTSSVGRGGSSGWSGASTYSSYKNGWREDYEKGQLARRERTSTTGGSPEDQKHPVGTIEVYHDGELKARFMKTTGGSAVKNGQKDNNARAEGNSDRPAQRQLPSGERGGQLQTPTASAAQSASGAQQNGKPGDSSRSPEMKQSRRVREVLATGEAVSEKEAYELLYSDAVVEPIDSSDFAPESLDSEVGDDHRVMETPSGLMRGEQYTDEDYDLALLHYGVMFSFASMH